MFTPTKFLVDFLFKPVGLSQPKKFGTLFSTLSASSLRVGFEKKRIEKLFFIVLDTLAT